MAIFEIPLKPFAQTISIQLGAIDYNITVYWNDAPDGGWTIDFFDANANPILCGLPMVTGANLLAQYSYFNFGGVLFCGTDGDLSIPPTYTDLGTTAHLWWQPNA